jgi:hypothetical protein
MQDKIVESKHILNVLVEARQDNNSKTFIECCSYGSKTCQQKNNMYRISLKLDCGHKHTKPPKNCSHKYNLFVMNCFGDV